MRFRRTSLAISLVFLLLITTPLCAHPPADGSSLARARLAESGASIGPAMTFSPMDLEGGAKLTIVSPNHWQPLIEELSLSLKATHQRMTGLLGVAPELSTSIRLMEEELFFQKTNAPRWTNALFVQGEIIIPLAIGQPLDYDNLHRTLRHEYTHALISELSGGRCPGWLDEGLAQWAEGGTHPALQEVLLEWLQSNPPIHWSMLQGGFTRLDYKMVPAAYAQSLFMTNTLIRVFGFPKIKKYFAALKAGKPSEQAFLESFDVSLENLEQRMSLTLRRWAARRSGG